MNLDPPDQSVIDAYVDEWRRILKGVLGWGDRQFDAWVSGKAGVLYNVYLDHDTEAWYVAPVMIPDALRQNLPDRATALRVRISHELEAARGPTPDWDGIRARVSSALAAYGAKLAVVQDASRRSGS
jgi:hypothetical protein